MNGNDAIVGGFRWWPDFCMVQVGLNTRRIMKTDHYCRVIGEPFRTSKPTAQLVVTCLTFDKYLGPASSSIAAASAQPKNSSQARS